MSRRVSPSVPRPARRAVVRCLSSARVLGAPAPGIAAIAAGRGRPGRPVWFVTHAGRPMPVSPSVSASGTSFSGSGLTETLSQPYKNLINTDPVRPVQPSVQYF